MAKKKIKTALKKTKRAVKKTVNPKNAVRSARSPAKKKPAKKKIQVKPEDAKKRITKIFPILVKTHPDAKTSLDHENPFQLLVATIMAAQCTDERVNIVTKDLFPQYPTPEHFANADPSRLEQDIRSTGFYRNKAKNIIAMAKSVVNEHSGRVPDTMEGLLSLAGVGRKTANVILGNCFNTQGIVCDTHVIRLSRRMGLSENSDPVKLEFDLMEIVPREKWGGWTMWSHVIVFHGRRICNARKPDCENCPVSEYCPSAFKPEFW